MLGEGRYSSSDSSTFRDNWRKWKKVREPAKEEGEKRLGRKGRTRKNGEGWREKERELEGNEAGERD